MTIEWPTPLQKSTRNSSSSCSPVGTCMIAQSPRLKSKTPGRENRGVRSASSFSSRLGPSFLGIGQLGCEWGLLTGRELGKRRRRVQGPVNLPKFGRQTLCHEAFKALGAIRIVFLIYFYSRRASLEGLSELFVDVEAREAKCGSDMGVPVR